MSATAPGHPSTIASDSRSAQVAARLERAATRDTAVVAMLASGALAYALKDVLSALAVIVIGVYVLVARPPSRALPSWLRIALIAAGVGYAFIPGGDHVRALARFLCAVASVTLFEGKSGRERGFVFFFSLAQLGLAAALLPGVGVAGLLVAGTIALHRALSSSHRARGASATFARGGVVLDAAGASPAMRAAHRGAFAVLVTGVALFPVLPRADAPLFALRAPRDVSSGGVGDSIELRSIGAVGDLDRVVGRVTPPDGEGTDVAPYLRAAVYDDFVDGRSWTSRATDSVTMSPSPGDDRSTYVLVEGDPIEPHGRWRLELDASVARRLPLPQRAFELDFAPPGPRWVQYDPRVRVVRTQLPDSARGLDVTVMTAAAGAAHRAEGPPDARCLALPTQVRLDVAPLIAGVVAAGPQGRALAQRLTDWVRGRCVYATSGAPGGRRPVQAFLTTDRTGHCEYFASALAVCLRCAGVPSRVVGGYVPSRWNDVGGFWALRGGDAHAWVEAYLEGGWVRFDAVPESARGPDPYRGFSGFFGRWRDAAEQFWSSQVLGFDRTSQLGLADAISKFVGSRVGNVRGWTFGRASRIAVSIATFALAVAFGFYFARRRRENLLNTIFVRVKFYRHALTLIRRRGAILRRADSACERVARSQAVLTPDGSAAFRDLTTEYEAIRYGGAASGPATRTATWLKRIDGR